MIFVILSEAKDLAPMPKEFVAVNVRSVAALRTTGGVNERL